MPRLRHGRSASGVRGAGGTASFELHPLTKDWGEGSSSGTGGGGSATPGDATWNFNSPSDANATITIDLEKQEIRGPDGGCIKFDIDAFRKHCLVNGLDDIGLTLQKGAKIDAYEARLKQSQPWIAA